MALKSTRTAKPKAAAKRATITVACPACGHEQDEAATAYSTTCKSCRQYIRVEKRSAKAEGIPSIGRAAAAPKGVAAPDPHAVVIACFDCGTVLAVSPSAQSTMCKRCSSYVDLADYKIAHSVSKNFRTKGTLVIEESGYLFNSETTASRVVLKGRFIGKLKSEGPLEIHPKAKINGTLFAGVLVIPPETVFTWPDTVEADRADIAGELIGDLHCLSTATLRAGARVFGNVTAGGLVIEDGAVLLGQVQVKPPAAPKRKA